MKIESPCRIHIGLIDLNGSIGRVDGGVGISLKEPSILIEGKESSEIEIETDEENPDIIERVKSSSKKILNYIGEEGIYLKIKRTIPQHTGLGSGTQLSLSVGKLISLIYGKNIDVLTLSKIMGRGGTSGIGVYAFESNIPGGFIVDGGHSFGPNKDKSEFKPSSSSKNVPPPPLIFKYPLDWKVVLVIPEGNNIYGNKEVDIFKKYCPIPLNETEKLSHLILMKMIPSVIEKDIHSFGDVVNKFQFLGFKKIEVSLQRDFIRNFIKKLHDEGCYSGLSSFGPTVYSICENNDDIKKVVDITEDFFDNINVNKRIIITDINNMGHRVFK